jgi:hypothetical protein
MRIFVSSTIYDLIDARAELKYMFDQLKIESKFSEINSSDFTVDYKRSSIESCLNNIKDVDYFITIIDKRYGPRLTDAGYGEISATHLEYRRAVEENKNIIFFIRNNTFSDYSFYKKSRDKENFIGNWVKSKADNMIFDFIDEHKRLTSKEKNNWFDMYSTSVELKEIVKKRIGNDLLAEKLTERIAFNELPNLVLSYEIQKITPRIMDWAFNGTVTNRGKTSAFIKEMEWINQENGCAGTILEHNESIPIVFLSKGMIECNNTLILKYVSYDGIEINDRIEVTCRLNTVGEGIIVHLGSRGKKYIRGEPIKVKFE